MNSCAYFEELISRMLDQDLNEQEQIALREHMDTCENCRIMFDSFSAVSDILSHDLEDVPADFSDSVMTEIRRSAMKPVRRKNNIRKFFTLAISAAAIAAIAVTIPQFRHSTMKSSVSLETYSTTSENVEIPSAVVSGTSEAVFSSSAQMESAKFSPAETDSVMSNESEAITVEPALCSDAIAVMSISEDFEDEPAPESKGISENSGMAMLMMAPASGVRALPETPYTITDPELCEQFSTLLTDADLSEDDTLSPDDADECLSVSLTDPDCIVQVFVFGDSVYSCSDDGEFYQIGLSTDDFNSMIGRIS